MKKLDLSVVILSFNTKDITDMSLERLHKAVIFCKKELGNKIEVIVVDNASSDGTSSMIKKKYPWVKLIESKVNTGFSKGNNIGMKESKYPYILLLNSDCFLYEDTLVDALNYFKIREDCDMLGVRLILPSGKTQISVGYLPDPWNTMLWISGIGGSRPIHPRSVSGSEMQVEWAMGAFLMLKREVFEATGGFDEDIFMYGEEVEWCKRIKDKGFKVFYVPSIRADHIDKASSGGNIEKPLISEFKGIKVYYKKHYKNWYFFISLFIKLFLVIRIIIFGAMLNFPRVRAYSKALAI